MVQSNNWPTPDYSYETLKRPRGFFDGWISDRYGIEDCGHSDEIETESVEVPPGLEYSVAYQDRMQSWDYDKYRRLADKHLDRGSFSSNPKKLIAFASEYFEKDVVAVRTVFYYNVATGYDCPTIEILYKKQSSDTENKS